MRYRGCRADSRPLVSRHLRVLGGRHDDERRRDPRPRSPATGDSRGGGHRHRRGAVGRLLMGAGVGCVRGRGGEAVPQRGQRHGVGRRGSPGPCRNRAWRSSSRTSSVSTPSATTRNPRLWPRSTMERTMARVGRVCVMSVTKPLSILSSWTGSDDRNPSDVCPTPKSSMLIRTPMGESSARARRARARVREQSRSR